MEILEDLVSALDMKASVRDIRQGLFHSTERIQSRLSREEGFKVTGVDVRLVGNCPKCQQHLLDEVNDEKQHENERR